MEKLNMVIGTFFSRIGTPLLDQLVSADDIDHLKEHLIISTDWHNEMFRDVQTCLRTIRVVLLLTLLIWNP